MRYIVRMAKHATSVRLSETGRRLMKALSEKMGVSQTAVVELALRRLARSEKIGKEGGNG